MFDAAGITALAQSGPVFYSVWNVSLCSSQSATRTLNRHFSVIDISRFFELNYADPQHFGRLGFFPDSAIISDHGVRANPDLTRLKGIEDSIEETPWTLVSVPTRNLSKSAKPVVAILSM